MELGLSDIGNDFALVPPILQYLFRVARILGQTVLGSQPSRKFLACAETKPRPILIVLTQCPVKANSAAVSRKPMHQQEYAKNAYPCGDPADDLRIG